MRRPRRRWIGLTKAVLAKLAGGIGVTGTFWQATQPVSLASAPLPPGAALDTSLQAIKAAIQAQIDLATSVWTDGTNFYVRRESVNEATGTITVSFTNPDGSASAVAATGLKPVASDNALTLLQTQFDVVAAGAGMAVNDILARVIVLNKAVTPPAASGAVWLNLTQGTTLAAAPSPAAIVEQTQHLSIASMPANVAQDSSVQAITTKLGAGIAVSIAAGADATTGNTTDPATASGASTSVIGALRAMRDRLLGTLTVAPTARAPASASTATVAAASTQLWPANAARAAWTIQAPQSADLWINPLGGGASIGGADCFRVAAGGTAKSTAGACETTAFTYYCATGGLALAAYQL